jgi:hypothetical protein
MESSKLMLQMIFCTMKATERKDCLISKTIRNHFLIYPLVPRPDSNSRPMNSYFHSGTDANTVRNYLQCHRQISFTCGYLPEYKLL